jgi:hypothetical protein
VPHRHAQTDPQTQKQTIQTADSILIYGSEDLLFTHFSQLCCAKSEDVDPRLATDRAEQQTGEKMFLHRQTQMHIHFLLS